MTTAADCLVETIQHWGIDTIFGLPGDGINGIMESLRERADKIRFVQVRHEESAAFMATAYAKYTGRLGCCLATSGPGAIHLLNGLYDAKLDQIPVLAITGSTYHDLIGTHYQQDIDEKVLYQGVSAYNERIMGPSHVRAVADLACRTALNDKCVSHLNFPTDMQHLFQAGLTIYTASGEHSRDLAGYMTALGIRDCFVTFYGPDLVGVPKESSRYYERVFAHAGVDPANALVVDDSASRLAVAAPTGARTVLCGRPAEASSRHEQISGLPELLQVLNVG